MALLKNADGTKKEIVDGHAYVIERSRLVEQIRIRLHPRYINYLEVVVVFKTGNVLFSDYNDSRKCLSLIKRHNFINLPITFECKVYSYVPGKYTIIKNDKKNRLQIVEVK